MNTHGSSRQVALKGFLVLLLVMLAFQSFGMNSLAAPITTSPNFQAGEVSQALTCIPSSHLVNPSYCDIRIVLMIDDSGSMNSNDRDGLRNAGARNLVDILVMHYYLPAVQFKADNPDVDFQVPDVQVAVIHFSNNVIEIPELIKPRWIKIDPSSIDDWKAQQVKLFEAIDWKNPAAPRTQTTNFIDPFEKAAELLAPVNGQAEEEGCIRRSIMLFTDGTPEDLQGRMSGDKLLNHMETVEKAVQGVQEKLPEQQKLRIYVTGFKVDPNYWDAVEPEWSRIVAFPPLAQDETLRSQLLEKDSFIQLPVRMEAITAFLSDVKTATFIRDPQDLQLYSIEIPNHVQSLRLTLYNLDSGAGLLITDPNGVELKADGEQVIASGEDTSIEVWQLDEPLAGSYQIRASKRGGVITGLLTYQNLALEIASEPGELQVGKPSDIKFKLVDSSGNVVLPEDDSLALKVSVTRDTQEFPLAWTGDTYQFSWTPESSGKSQFKIMASLAPVDAQEDMLLDCSGDMEVDVPPLDEKLTMVITTPIGCVPPAEAITLPVQLEYQGEDSAWASSLEWADVSAKAEPGDQIVNVTRNTINETSGQYELSIGPIDNAAQFQEILVNAKAVMKGRTTEVSDNKAITFTLCYVPDLQCDCEEGWILWFWPLLILLAGLLIILLLYKFGSERTVKNYQEAKQDISRTRFWHLLFWPLMILFVLLVLDRLLTNISIPLWLFLALILVWIFSLLLIRFTPDGKYTRRRPWWLIVLLLLLVLVWYLFFSTLWASLLWFLSILLVFLLVILIWPAPACTRDDLTVIEGIGPGVEKLLNDNGIYTFQQLADADIDELNAWLNHKGWDYMDPKTWPYQAELADKAKKSGKKEDQDKFDEYAAWVKDGIAPDEYNKPEKDRKPPQDAE